MQFLFYHRAIIPGDQCPSYAIYKDGKRFFCLPLTNFDAYPAPCFHLFKTPDGWDYEPREGQFVEEVVEGVVEALEGL